MVKRNLRTVCLLFLVILMLAGIAQISAAEKATQLEPQRISWISPFCPDGADGRKIGGNTLLYGQRAEVETVQSMAEAAELLKAGVQAHEELVYIDLEITQEEYYATESVLQEIYDLAHAHTGQPDEGDYLRNLYGYYEGALDGYMENGMCYLTAGFGFVYFNTAEQEAEMDAAVAKLIADLELEGAGDYRKATAIYAWLCDNVVYDTAGVETGELYCHSAHAALMEKNAVCQGYMSLMYRLLLEVGVDNRCISGVGAGGAHGWNIVEMGGLYYNADATWDAGMQEYDWFLRSMANFPDHTRDEEYTTEQFNAAYPMGDRDYAPLGVPELTVTTRASDGKPYLKWTPVKDEENVDGYEVWRANSKNGAYTKIYIAAVDDLDVVHTGAIPGNDYFYKVRAIRGTGAGAFSEIKGVWCDLTAPTVTVSNRASDGKPVIRWSKVPYATGYQVYRSGSKNGTYTLMYTAPADDLDVVHTGAAAGNDYFYKVIATHTNSKSNSPYSEAKGVWCDLKQPKLTVTTNSKGKPHLTWTQSPGAGSYKVYRATNDGGFTLMYTAKADDLDVTHTGAVKGNDYTYKVMAVHPNQTKCNSAYSAVQGICLEVLEQQPTITVTNRASDGKPTISWSAVDGAMAYEVWRSSTKNGTYKLITTVAAPKQSLVYVGAEAGRTYYFKVCAVHQGNEFCSRSYSEARGVWCDLPRPQQVSVALNSSGQPNITWGRVFNAGGYEVWGAVNGGEYTRLHTAESNVFGWTHADAQAGNTYTYKVLAVWTANSKSNSAFSTETSITMK